MKIIVGNWKMNGDRPLADALTAASAGAKHKIILCPPFTLLHHIKNITLGAQDCSAEPKGAYTGDVSATMLKDAGCEWVILGHSERRQHHKETDELIRRKFEAAIAAGLKVILCVGEKTGEDAEAVVKNQLSFLSTTYNLQPATFLIAYEPVWAIGSGLTATAADIDAMHNFIKSTVISNAERNPDFSHSLEMTKVLYGGSVKPDNIKEILAIPSVDGVLVGGASVEPAAWSKIVQS